VQVVEEPGELSYQKLNPTAAHYRYLRVKGYGLHWSELRKKTQNIGEAINKANDALEEHNPTLEGVLASVDFNDKDRLPDNTLLKLLDHFSKYRLRNEDLSEPDLLGRAYEYLIAQFADDAGKKGGELYTPRKVVELIVRLIKPEEGMRICDPACGSIIQHHSSNIQILVLNSSTYTLDDSGCLR